MERNGFYAHPSTLDDARTLVLRTFAYYGHPLEPLEFHPCPALEPDRIAARGARYVEILAIVENIAPTLAGLRPVEHRTYAPPAPRTARQAETSESLARMLALGMLMDAKREALEARRAG